VKKGENSFTSHYKTYDAKTKPFLWFWKQKWRGLKFLLFQNEIGADSKKAAKNNGKTKCTNFEGMTVLSSSIPFWTENSKFLNCDQKQDAEEQQSEKFIETPRPTRHAQPKQDKES